MPGSPARRLMVDVHVWRGKAKWISHKLEENNHKFLMDLSRALLGVPRIPCGEAPSSKTMAGGAYREIDEHSAKRQRTN